MAGKKPASSYGSSVSTVEGKKSYDEADTGSPREAGNVGSRTRALDLRRVFPVLLRSASQGPARIRRRAVGSDPRPGAQDRRASEARATQRGGGMSERQYEPLRRYFGEEELAGLHEQLVVQVGEVRDLRGQKT